MSQATESVQARDTSAEAGAQAAPAVGDHGVSINQNHKPRPPVEEEIMHFARIGDIRTLQELFDSGRYDAAYKDDEGITPLHVCDQLSLAGISLTFASGPLSTISSKPVIS